ncbi:hypothetical protein [Pasteurella multocida]|uniref:hypothetical protein n=1 Tax=Pasteurella multocida TaxID=747 RepID=UPI002877730F|nr:hypothetical protein [Pasteurella multocida]WND41233.1 hypothetical protein RHO09_06480 [Pasteurella multocida]
MWRFLPYWKRQLNCISGVSVFAKLACDLGGGDCLAALDFACLVDMKLFGYTLNSISSLAITLVIGILVDYVIV